MAKHTTTPIAELIARDYHATDNIVLRARAAYPHATHEELSRITDIRVGLVRRALGVDDDGEPAAVVTGGVRKRGDRINKTNPAGTTIKPWEVESLAREKKRKAAAEQHKAWLIKKGVRPVSPQEDTPPTRARAHGWRG